jgi:hypothetical protein
MVAAWRMMLLCRAGPGAGRAAVRGRCAFGTRARDNDNKSGRRSVDGDEGTQRGAGNEAAGDGRTGDGSAGAGGARDASGADSGTSGASGAREAGGAGGARETSGEDAVERLRERLTVVREQVRRLNRSLNQTESLRASAKDRLQVLRAMVERLEQTVRTEEAAARSNGGPDDDAKDGKQQMSAEGGERHTHPEHAGQHTRPEGLGQHTRPEGAGQYTSAQGGGQPARPADRAPAAPLGRDAASTPGASPAPPAWEPVIRRGRASPRHLVTIELREPHLHAMLVSGLLSINDVDDGTCVRQVIQALLNRWSEQYDRPEPGRQGRKRGCRRSGKDRRRATLRPGSLFGAIAGGPLDRRRRGERRVKHDDAVPGSEPAQDGVPEARQDGVREARQHGGHEAGQARERTPPRDNVVRLDTRRAPRASPADARPAPTLPRERDSGPRPAPERDLGSAPERDLGSAPERDLGSAPERDLGSAPERDLGSAPERGDGVQRERGPDAGEGHEAGGAQRLPVDQHRQREMARRRDVLQQAQRGEPDAPGAGDEQDQR